MHRLQIMERREEEVKRQVTEKSHHITQLAERIAVSYYFFYYAKMKLYIAQQLISFH